MGRLRDKADFEEVAAQEIDCSSSPKLVAVNSSGDFVLADNTSTETFTVGLAGVDDRSYSVGDKVWVFRHGKFNGFSGLTPGLLVYLGTAGGLTQTAPTADDTVVQEVGIAVGSDTIILDIQMALKNVDGAIVPL